MFGRFKFRGNRPYIRLDKELAEVDKTAADQAFKKYKKKILDEFLISNGFIKYKINAYVRKNSIDVLEYINLQKEKYGSKTFTVNYAIMPLYVPHDYIQIGLGGRLGELICDKDIWWDYACDDIAQVSFRNVLEAIDRFLFPWFAKYSDENYLLKKLTEDTKKSKRIGIASSYKNEAWICALEKCDGRSEMIAENIRRLKLPKGAW